MKRHLKIESLERRNLLASCVESVAPVVAPVAEATPAITVRNFLVSNFQPTETESEPIPPKNDGVINQRDFLVSNIGDPESEFERTLDVLTNYDASRFDPANATTYPPALTLPNGTIIPTVRTVGLPAPTPSNPNPTITPEMVRRSVQLFLPVVQTNSTEQLKEPKESTATIELVANMPTMRELRMRLSQSP